MENKDTDVLIIGSGFGGAVAALRFSEAGYAVTVLERGGWINRENFEADDDMFWQPQKGRYGMNDLQKRGRHIIPWLGAGVGGGSHVYAGTLKRRDFFDDFPGNLSAAEMAPYYERAEKMMQAMKYPDYPPYNNLPSYILFREAEKKLQKQYPELVESQGDILLAISYAPEGVKPGTGFVNMYGASQRYSDPGEQKLLGGDIDVKNTLDKNYLFEAQKKGAKILAFKEAVKIEPLDGGGYRVYWKNPRKDSTETGSISTRILVCSAGSIGSTTLLLQNKILHKTLPKLSAHLGRQYHINGDYVTFILPKKGLLLSWIGLLLSITGLIIKLKWLPLVGAALYLLGWLRSDKKAQPDKGSTNSDYIRFKHRDGSAQGVYIEGGRYPTPIKALAAILMSLNGNFNPQSYKSISHTINALGKYLPVFELLERSWPIPMLMMGRDDAIGHFYFEENEEINIAFPFSDNKKYIAYLNKLGQLFARQADSYFIPNGIAHLLKILEVPHNIGGVPMGTDASDGVVDNYGSVFGYENFYVLDGSILPVSLGPNPVNTILAFAERSMEKIIANGCKISIQ